MKFLRTKKATTPIKAKPTIAKVTPRATPVVLEVLLTLEPEEAAALATGVADLTVATVGEEECTKDAVELVVDETTRGAVTGASVEDDGVGTEVTGVEFGLEMEGDEETTE